MAPSAFIKEVPGTTQVNRLHTMRREGLVEDEMLDILHLLRKKGNDAIHSAGYGTTKEALQILALANQLSIWFMQVYVDWKFSAPKFVEPLEVTTSSHLHEQIKQLQAEIDEKEKELEEVIAVKEVEKEVRIKNRKLQNRRITGCLEAGQKRGNGG